MLDLARELLPLLREGAAVAAVTVAGVPRSAPRGVGATMAVTAGAQIVGSISGGCVEGDALMLALSVLRDGAARTARLGFGDEDAYAAGLACGGALDVVAYPVHVDDPDVCDALDAAAADRAVTVGLVTAGPEAGRVLPLHALRRAVAPSSPKPSGVEAPGASVAAALDDAERLRESFMLESAYGGAGCC